ncbi:MAG TPA: hypothetical protein VGH40_22680 [Roseiarcus sp.]
MKSSCVALCALMLLSGAAMAQGWSPYLVSRQDIAWADRASPSLYPADRYVRNANNCGSELVRAVWGRYGELLGYACYSNPNGS